MKMFAGLLGAVGALLTVAAFQPASAGPREDCYQAEDSLEIVKACTAVIDADPKAAWALDNRARGYDRLRKYQQAMADLDRAIRLDPKMAIAYARRGSVQVDLEQYDKAIADLDIALRMETKEPWFWSTRARAYMGKNELAKAITDWDTAIKLDPKGYINVYNRAIAYNRLGDTQKALTDYQAVLRLIGQKKVPQDHLDIVETSKKWVERLSK